MTQSGRKVRHALTHPDDLAANVEQAGSFLQRKASMVSDQIHGVIRKAKQSIEEGERAYREAGQQYKSQARQLETKSETIAASIHNTVDRMSRTAGTIERSVLDPICEIGAIYRGVERGIRTLLGKHKERFTPQEGPIPIMRDQRVMGS
jgi:ElaB/YqjD/DUF883 family membrane-anchored ribosome-binding protein